MTAELCTKKVDRGSGRWVNYQPCGRVAVKDGLCKLHLKVKERRDAKSRAYRAKAAEGEQLRDEAERLSEILGVDIGAHYAWNASKYDGRFVVPGDWLRKLAETAA